MRRPRSIGLLAAAVVAAGCSSDDALTVYLEARLGPNGPPGQRSVVVSPVERERRQGMSAARQAVLAVLVGPSPEERARGFRDTVPLATRLLDVRVAGGTATVALAGAEPDLAAAAAIVYSLTELPHVRRVVLRVAGGPCCVYRHDGTPVETLTRETFRYWSGEPCHLRTTPTHVRCARR